MRVTSIQLSTKALLQTCAHTGWVANGRVTTFSCKKKNPVKRESSTPENCILAICTGFSVLKCTHTYTQMPVWRSQGGTETLKPSTEEGR